APLRAAFLQQRTARHQPELLGSADHPRSVPSGGRGRLHLPAGFAVVRRQESVSRAAQDVPADGVDDVLKAGNEGTGNKGTRTGTCRGSHRRNFRLVYPERTISKGSIRHGRVFQGSRGLAAGGSIVYGSLALDFVVSSIG